MYIGDHTKSFGSMSRKMDDEVREGGYVRGGVGGGSTFTAKSGVDGSSFFIPNLFTLNPVPQYSQFHQTIPSSPSSVLLFLCTIRNSLLNRLTFAAWISASCLILLILLFICLLLFYPQPFSDVFRIKVLDVLKTCVLLNYMDVRCIVQCVGECEEVVSIEEVVAI